MTEDGDVLWKNVFNPCEPDEPQNKLRSWDNVSYEERADILRRLCVVLDCVAAWLRPMVAGNVIHGVADGFAKLRDTLPERDYTLEDVPPALESWQWLVHRVGAFFHDGAAKSFPEDARTLLDLVLRVRGRADGDSRYLLELELLAVSARRMVAEANRDAAEARADAAAARGDAEESRRQRGIAEDACAKLKKDLADERRLRREFERLAVLQEETNKRLSSIEGKVDGVPGLVNNARIAMEEPLKMAKEIHEFARKELSGDALALFFVLEENGGSVNAASKTLKRSRQTLDRKFHSEIAPFCQRHNIPLPGKQGRSRLVPYDDGKRHGDA